MSDSDSSMEEEEIPGTVLIPRPEYRNLMFARHWYTHARHLCLTENSWKALLKYYRPSHFFKGNEKSLSNFCFAYKIPFKDMDTLRELKISKEKSPALKQRCKGTSVRGTRCTQTQSSMYCAIHEPPVKEDETQLVEIPIV